MISLETILEAEDSLRNMDERETLLAVRRFERKQPAVFVYLAAVSEREEFNEDEQDAFFTIALVLWMALSRDSDSVKKVSIKTMEALDEAAERILAAGHGRNLDPEDALRRREPNLLEFIRRRCNEPDAGTPLREDSKPHMVFFLGIVLKGLLSIDE